MAQTRRAHILMEPDEYDQLERLAERQRVSVAELIRRAVRERYLQPKEQRVAAANRIASMSIPLPSWPELKREIEEAYDDLP